jgi:hypothetical protein
VRNKFRAFLVAASILVVWVSPTPGEAQSAAGGWGKDPLAPTPPPPGDAQSKLGWICVPTATAGISYNEVNKKWSGRADLNSEKKWIIRNYIGGDFITTNRRIFVWSIGYVGSRVFSTCDGDFEDNDLLACHTVLDGDFLFNKKTMRYRKNRIGDYVSDEKLELNGEFVRGDEIVEIGICSPI